MAKNVILKIPEKGAKKTAGALKSVGGVVADLGKKASLVGGGFAILSTKLAGDFQKNLLEVSTLMNNFTSRDLDAMSKQLRSVSQSSGLALSSLSKAKYDIVSAGFSNAADSAMVLDASAKLAVGGVTSAASAADILTTSLNAFGLEASQVNDVSDVLFTTVRLGKTTMDELGASLGQVLPFAKSMNLSLKDVGAAMATLTASGVNTAESTTALRAAIQSLSAPSEGAKKAMQVAGIEVKKFSDGTVDLVSTIEQFAGMDPQTITKFIPNVRAVLAIQTMANNFDTLRDNVNQFSSDSADATEKAFNKMSKGFNTQMAMLKNSIQSVMIEIGNVIIDIIQPKVEEANKELAKLGEIGFNNLGEAVKDHLPVIMDAFQVTMMIAFNHVEKRAKIMALGIKEHLRDAMPFIEGEFDKIAEFSDLMDKKAQQDAEFLAQTYKDMYAAITERAEEYAEDDFDLRDATVEHFVNGVLQQEEAHIESQDRMVENEAEATQKKIENISLLEMRLQDHNAKIAIWDEEAKARDVKELARKRHAVQQKSLFFSQEFGSAVSHASGLAGLAKQASALDRKNTMRTKSFAKAEALFSAFEAANKTFAQFGGWPLGVVPAGLALAIGLENVKMIDSQSFASGGIVQGTDTGRGDTVPAMLTPGELILNQSQQNNLANNMSGVTINFSGPVTNDEYVRDFIIPEIQRTIKNNLA